MCFIHIFKINKQSTFLKIYLKLINVNRDHVFELSNIEPYIVLIKLYP